MKRDVFDKNNIPDSASSMEDKEQMKPFQNPFTKVQKPKKNSPKKRQSTLSHSPQNNEKGTLENSFAIQNSKKSSENGSIIP